MYKVTYCKYTKDKPVIATKHCHQCGDGLCSGCGYSMESNNDQTVLCNECYNDIMSMVEDDRNVGLREEQYVETIRDIDPERVELSENLL